jgi:hypothetical protein
MGAESGNAFERFIFGGKNLGAISQFPWPAIIVPPQAQFKINKISLACDLGNVVETIRLSEIKRIVSEFGAELHIINGGVDTEINLTKYKAKEMRFLQSMMDGLRPFYDFINGESNDQIIEIAAQIKIDPLVMMPKKHSIIQYFEA